MPRKYATRMDRLADGVVKTDSGCWEFSPRNVRGYGSIGSGVSGKHLLAHRVMWEMCCGPIPTGLCVLHACDNRACVRPDHLFLGTTTDNNVDRSLKGRTINQNMSKSICKRGHPLVGDNVYHDPIGKRRCRECRRQLDRSNYAKLSAEATL
jgi:hypothetical protein